MQERLTRIQGAWLALPRRAQLSIAGVAIVTLVIVLLIFRAATSTEYAVVTADGLKADQLGTAQAELEKGGFTVRTSEDGTALEVPTSEALKAQSALTTAGIGTRTSCSEQFASGGMGVAKSSQEIEIARTNCMENELATVVEQLPMVEAGSATVQLNERSDRLFREEQEDATASVWFASDGSGNISDETVAGIQKTVANSVEGLAPDGVAVMDTSTGETLTENGDERLSGPSKLEIEARYNMMLEQRLTAEAERIVGSDNVSISSNVELDMDEIDRAIVDYGGEDNAQGPVSAEKIADELLDDATGSGVEGVAGTPTNLIDPDNRTVTADDTDATDDGSTYIKKDGATTYANDEVQERILVAPGKVMRNRIAVTVDDDVDPASAAAVRDNVQTLMGGNPDDSFAFNQAPLAIAAAKQAEAAATSRVGAIMGYVKWALLGIALLALAFVVRRSLTQRTAELLNPLDDMLLLEPGFEPIPIAELEAVIAAQAASTPDERRQLMRTVEAIAERSPQDVANELRRWMHQDDQQSYLAQSGRR